MTNQTPTSNAISRIAMVFFVIVPTAISVFLAFEVRSTANYVRDAESVEKQIVCFTPDMCAIEVAGVWYQIAGVIDMAETIPEEYLPHVTVEEAITADADDDQTN